MQVTLAKRQLTQIHECPHPPPMEIGDLSTDLRGEANMVSKHLRNTCVLRQYSVCDAR